MKIISSQRSQVKGNLVYDCMTVLEGGAFEKYLNHEGGASQMGVGAFRNLRELPHHFNLVIT